MSSHCTVRSTHHTMDATSHGGTAWRQAGSSVEVSRAVPVLSATYSVQKSPDGAPHGLPSGWTAGLSLWGVV